MCVFSVHSVIKDPPFSKLDLISCRNLLIYLGGDLQDRVISIFHYALIPGGWLFLGPSESTGHGAGLFESAGKRHRLFRRRTRRRRARIAPRPSDAPPGLLPRNAAPAGLAQLANVRAPGRRGRRTLDRNARRALEQYSPAYVVIDRACDIIRFSGGAVGRYPGTVTGRRQSRPVRHPAQAAAPGGSQRRACGDHWPRGSRPGRPDAQFRSTNPLITLIVNRFPTGGAIGNAIWSPSSMPGRLRAYVPGGRPGYASEAAMADHGCGGDDDRELA